MSCGGSGGIVFCSGRISRVGGEPGDTSDRRALPVAKWAKSRKSHLLSGAPLAGYESKSAIEHVNVNFESKCSIYVQHDLCSTVHQGYCCSTVQNILELFSVVTVHICIASIHYSESRRQSHKQSSANLTYTHLALGRTRSCTRATMTTNSDGLMGKGKALECGRGGALQSMRGFAKGHRPHRGMVWLFSGAHASHWPAVCIARSVAIRKSYRLPNATKPLFSDALAAGTRSQELLR